MKNQNVLHKVISVAMAFFLLCSTVSFTVEKHFCGDVLVDVSLFASAEKCAMESLEVSMKKNCCKDVLEIIQGQDELKLATFDDLSPKKQLLVATFVVSYLQTFKHIPKKVIPHHYYTPPNLVYDIHILDQVFLI